MIQKKQKLSCRINLHGFFIRITLVLLFLKPISVYAQNPDLIDRGKIITYSSFDLNTGGWATGQNVYHRDRAFHLKSPSHSGRGIWRRDLDTRRATIAIDATALEDSEQEYGFGIDLRHQKNPSARLGFYISTRGFFAVFRFDERGNHTTLVSWKQDAAIHQGIGKKNRLEVRAWDDVFEFYINGRKVAGIRDNNYPSGSVGLFANRKQHIVFDNFIFYESRLIHPPAPVSLAQHEQISSKPVPFSTPPDDTANAQKNDPTASTEDQSTGTPEIHKDRPSLKVDPAPLTVKVEPVYTHDGKMAARSGGTVLAPDGMSISYRAGALDRDASVRIKKSFPALDEEREQVTIYDIDLAGARLRQPVTVTLPLQSSPERQNAKATEVYHFNSARKAWEEIPAKPSADGKSVVFEARQFSAHALVEPSWFLPWRNYYESAKSEGRIKAPLNVPYYYQGGYGWCWAASLSMVDGFQNAFTKIWEIASFFGVDSNDAASSPGKAKEFLDALHGNYRVATKFFWSSKALNGYLMYHLDRNRPVWIGLPYAGHAVVVVGYAPEAIAVHDPSGALIKRTGGAEDPEQLADDGVLGSLWIPWGRWDMVTAGNWMKAAMDDTADVPGFQQTFSGIVWPVGTMVVESPPSHGRTLSLQLMSLDTFKIERPFVRADGRRTSPHEINFYWNGKIKNGYHFVDGNKQTTLSNSDHIKALVPFLSNTSSRPQSVRCLVTIDDQEIANQEHSLAADKVHRPLELSAFSRNMKLSDNPLPLGDHVFKFRLQSGESPVDKADIHFRVVPAMVSNVEVIQVDDKTLKITWAPNVEERRLGTRMVYYVRRSKGRGATAGSRIATVGPGKHEFKYQIPEKDRGEFFFYSVWAYDPETKLESPDAVLNRPAKEKGEGFLPLIYGSRFEYDIRVQGGFMDALRGNGQNYSSVTKQTMEVTGNDELTTHVAQTIKNVVPMPDGKTMVMIFKDDMKTIQSFEKSPDAVSFGNSRSFHTASYDYGRGGVSKQRSTLNTTYSTPIVVLAKPKWPEPGTTWSNHSTRDIKVVSKQGSVIPKDMRRQMSPQMTRKMNAAPGRKVEVSQHRSVGFEAVSVKAGRFEDCARIEISYPDEIVNGNSIRTRKTQWYAEGVGLVREVDKKHIRPPQGEAYNMELVTELTFYKIPKDE